MTQWIGVCRQCAYFRAVTNSVGQCVRYAPRPRTYDEADNVELDRGRHFTDWPWVDNTDYCGDWRAK